MKLGRFVVDTHVHAHRHAAGKALKGSKEYSDLGHAVIEIEASNNAPRLLYDMECYGVDMCVLEPAFGMTNELSVEQVKKYPGKFVASCQAKATRDKALKGEIRWTMDAACEELHSLLGTGNFVGIGECMPMPPNNPNDPSYEERDEQATIKDMMKVMNLGRKYKVPVRYHSGTPGGYAIAYHGFPATYNPLWAHTLAVAYPDVPIIMEHAGIEGGW